MDYTLIEGDCRVRLASLRAASVDCCVTSPPYWYPAPVPTSAMGKQRSLQQYAEELTAIFMEVRRVLNDDGALWVILGDDPRGGPGAPPMVAASMEAAGWTVAREFTWEDRDTGLEPQSVFLFTKAPLAAPPRIEETLWRFPLEPARHNYDWATLPVSLVARCIEASSDTGGLILDPFCGLASTGVAALILGRTFIGIDTDRRALQLAWERLRNAGRCGSKVS